jgi:hypothetical protein
MLFLPNRREFLRIKNNLLASIKDWNSQYSSDKWSVSEVEPGKYPCYVQMVPTINYQHYFFFFYDN